MNNVVIILNEIVAFITNDKGGRLQGSQLLTVCIRRQCEYHGNLKNK